MSKSKILFQVTGSIACYKACSLISKLVQEGFDVQVVSSPAALQFVGAATLEGLTGKAVVSDLFSSGHAMDHIHLIRWADLVITAPATANFINKVANGIGDDLLTTLFLAHDFKKPYLIAPAMNTFMYLHPVTQKSIEKLKDLHVEILETASGVLACGEMGLGRLLDPELLYKEILRALKKLARKDRSVLITSGGTEEPLDQVRSITNKSTGATGAAIADTLLDLGFDVTYLHAARAQQPHGECQREPFVTFRDLHNKLRSLLTQRNYTAVVHTAAVSDFSLAEPITTGKLSSEQDLHLHLKKNPKLVNSIREWSQNHDLQLIAFKLTASGSENEPQLAVNKLFEQSKADMVIQNDCREIQASTGKHAFHAYIKNKKTTDLQNKTELSSFIGNYLSEVIL